MLTSFLRLLLLLVTFCVLAAAFLFRFLWRQHSNGRTLFVKLSTTLCALLSCFLLLEFLASAFFIYSDGSSFTLASKRWVEKYWRPINSLGFRDHEHDAATLANTNVLFIAGDSFVAGHGIDDISERFSGLLAEALGETWSVVVLAQNGWDTEKAYEAIRGYPVLPDRVIVSYYYNDIEGACKKNGYERPKRAIRKPDNFLLRFLVDNSYLVNSLYWRTYRWEDLTSIYWDYRVMCFNDAEVWESHREELLKIVDFARSADAHLAFLIWPKLDNVAESQQLTSKLGMFLENQEVKVLDLGDRFLGRDPAQLMVNRMDAHPNVEINAEVATMLHEWLGPWN